MNVEIVTVIVVTYNSAHCIERLSSGLTMMPYIIVMDNGSQDDSIAVCRRFLPQAMIESLGRNLGFGRANNRALLSVVTPYALLLNPDCEITAVAIDELLRVAQSQPDAAICVPQLVDKQGKPVVNYGWVKHLWHSKSAIVDGLCCVGYASGAVLLLNLSITRPLGFFDEQFFLYYEDDDLCCKYFNAHLPIIVAPHVKVFHASRASVKTNKIIRQEFWRGYHHAQSRLLIAEKYQTTTIAQRLRWTKICTGILHSLLRLVTLNPRMCARMFGRVVGLWRYTSYEHKPTAMTSFIQTKD